MSLASRRLLLVLVATSVGCSRNFASPSSATAPQFGAIQGMVVLASPSQAFPALLPDVDVAITQPGGIQLHTVTTSQGVFTFGSLAAGTYALEVDVNPAPGAPVLFAARTSVGSVVVTAGKTTNVGQVQPTYLVGNTQPGFSQVEVYGLVRANLHVDGGLFVFDGGLDSTGTQVNVYFAGQESQPFTVTFTQSDGTFGQQLPPGTYDLYASNPLFVPGSELGIVVGADGGSDGGVESLPQPIVMAINPARLAGSVVMELDTSIFDGGANVGDGWLFVAAPDVSVTTAFGGIGSTDPSGSFIINNLLGAPDQVTFQANNAPLEEGYHTSQATFPVTLKPGQLTNMTPHAPVQLLLNRGTVKGKVKMTDGSPVLGVTVALSGSAHGGVIPAPEADPSVGDYEFDNVVVRSGLNVTAQAQVQDQRYPPVSQPVAVSFVGNGAVTEVQTIYLSPQRGDFVIASADPNAHAGFTNTLDVSIIVSGAPAGSTQLRVAENANFTFPDGGTAAWQSLGVDDGGNHLALSDADGFHTVYAQYQDPNMNTQGPLLTSTVLVDRVRPTEAQVAVTSGKTFVNTNQNVSIALIATDPNESPTVPASGVSGMVVAKAFTGSDFDGGVLPGAIVPYAAHSVFPPDDSVLADGLYTIYAQYYDNAGNASPIVTAPLVVDTVPPTGSLTITSLTTSDTGFTNSPLVLVNELFGLVDGGTSSAPNEPNGGTDTIQLSNSINTVANAAPLPASGQQTWSLDTSSGDGQKKIFMLITDSAGNVSNHGTPYEASIFLERTAPLGTVSLIAPSAGGLASVNPTSTNDVHVTLQYALNGGTASDPAATGVEASEQPTSCSSLPPPAYQTVTGTTATIHYTFAGSTDGGGIEDGNKTIFSCLRNAAGNTTELETQVLLNRQSPSAAVTVGNGATFQDDGSTTTVTLSAFSPDITGIEVSTSPLNCDGGTFTPFNPTDPIVQVGTPTDGTYTVYICVEDAAGNITSLPSFSFTKDSTTPTGTLAIVGSLANRTASSTLTATPVVALDVTASAGPGDPVVSMQVANDSVGNLAHAVAQPLISPLQWQLSNGDGVKQVFVQFIDEAGKVSAPLSAQITLYTASPLVGMTLTANGIVNPQATDANAVQIQYLVGADTNLPLQVALFSEPQNCGSATGYGPMPAGTPPTQIYQLRDGLYPDGGGPLPDGGALVNDQITVFACFEDPAGNTSSAIATLIHDTIPPSGTVTFGNGQAVQGSGAQNLIISASSDTTEMIVSSTGCTDAGASSYVPFNTTVAETLSNGVTSLYVCLRNLAGTEATASPYPLTVDIDSTLPSGSITLTGELENHTPSTTVTATPVVSVQVTGTAALGDSVVSMQVANDSVGNLANAVAQTFTPTFAWQLSNGDGVKQVFVQFIDQAGKVSSPLSAQIVLDTSSPPVGMTVVANGVSNAQATNSNSVQLQYTVGAGANLPLQVALSNGPEDCASASGYAPMPAGSPPTQTYPLTDGLYPDAGGPLPDGGALVDDQITIFACFEDAAGNTSSAIATLLHDTIPPSGTAVFGNGQAVQSSGSQNLVISASSDTTEMLVGGSALNCATAAASSYVPFNTSIAETLPTGSNTLYVCLRDQAGNTAAVSPFPVTVDVDPTIPTGTLSIQGELVNHTVSTTVTSTPLVTLAITAAAASGDPVVSMLVANDTASNLTSATWQPMDSSLSWQLSSANGTKQVWIEFMDQAGKTSVPLSASINLVTVGPQNPSLTWVPSVAAPPNCVPQTGMINNPKIFVTAAASPPDGTIDLSDSVSFSDSSTILGLGSSITSQAFTFPAGDGAKTLFARFTDSAGNSTITTASLVLDTAGVTSPTATIVQSPYTNTATLSVQLSATGSPSSVSIAATEVGGLGSTTTTNVPFAGTVAVPVPADVNGLKKVVATIFDAACNASVAPMVSTTLDTVNPTITSANFTNLSDPANNATNFLAVGVTFNGFTGPVAAYRLSTDQTFAGGAQPFINFASNGSAVSGPQSVGYSLPSGDGTKTVYAQVQDLAGNLSSPPTSLSVKLIQTAPSATTDIYVGAIKDPTYTDTANVTLQFTVSANLTQVAASLSQQQCASVPGASWQNLSGAPPTMPFTLQGTGNPAQVESVYVCFRDAANNYASTTNTITFSTQAPTATMTVGNGAAYQNVSGSVNAVFSSFSADTTGVAVSTSSLTCSSATYGAFSTSNPVAAVALGADGPYTVYACLKDAAGNTSLAPLTFSFTKDTVNPTITGASFTNLTGTNATDARSVGVTFAGFTGPVTSYRLSTDQTFGGNTQPFVSFASPGSQVSGPQQVPYTLPAGDNTYTVYAQVQDLAGNLSTPATALTPVKLIQTAPTATTNVFVGATANPAATNQANVTLKFTLSANLTQVYASSSPQTCSTIPSASWQNLTGSPPQMPFTLQGTGNPPATQSIYVCFRDAANNTVSTVNTIVFNTESITATMTVGNGQAIQAVSTLPVAFTSVTPLVTLMNLVADNPPTCSNLGAYSAYAQSTNLPMVDGSHTIYACLADAAGNFTAAPLTFAVQVDTTKPTVTSLTFSGLSDQPASLTNSPSINVILSGVADATSGVSLARVSSDPTFNGVSFAPATVVGTTITLQFTLPATNGADTLYAQVEDRAGNVSSSVNGTVTLDTQGPVWTTAPSAPLYVKASSVTIAFAGTDNIDTTSQFLAAFTTTAGACSAAVYQPYNNGSVSFSPLTGGTTTTLYGCLKDRAGNITPSPSTVSVTYLSAAPLASKITPNVPVALASGALISWTDTNTYTQEIAVDYSLDPTFTTGLNTDTNAVGSCSSSGVSHPPTSIKVGLTGADVPLTNLENWYFRIRAIDCAGNASGNVAVPGSAVPNLGSAALPSAPIQPTEVIADGPDLWIHSVANILATPEVRQEAVMHCVAGSVDCRNPANWASFNVVIDNAVYALTSFDTGIAPATMLVTDDTLYLVDQVDDMTHGNTSNQVKLAMAYCDRTTNCEVGSNWVPNNFIREAADTDLIIAPKGAVSGSALAVFYGFPESAYSYVNYISFSRCDRALGQACRAAQSWTQVDSPIPVQNNGFTVAATDDHIYLGAVSSQAYGNITQANEPIILDCQNSCASAGAAGSGCNGTNCGCYATGQQCGDMVFFTLTNTFTGPNPFQPLPPASAIVTPNPPSMVASQGNLYLGMTVRTTADAGPTDTTVVGVCQGDCFFGSSGLGVVELPIAVNPAPLGSPYAGAALSVAGGLQDPNPVVRLSYVNQSGPTMLLDSCNATNPANCENAASWIQATVATGTGNERTPASVTVGRNLYTLGYSLSEQPLLYQPIVATPVNFQAVPQAGQIYSNWNPLVDTTGSVVAYGPAATFPAGDTSVSISDPLTAFFATPGLASAERSTVTSVSAEGIGDTATSWSVTPFKSLSSAKTDLQPSFAFSLSSPGPIPASAGLAADTNVYASYLSSGTGMPFGYCNTLTDCSQSGNWTWGQSNSNPLWNDDQLTVDYPRAYPNNSGSNTPTANTARVFNGGLWDNGSLYVEGCVLNGAGSCSSTADYSNQAIATTSSTPPINADTKPSLRAAGDLVETVENAANGSDIIVRYCDGSHSYPHSNCQTPAGAATDRPLNYCFNPANWKAVTLGGSNYGGVSNPSYGAFPGSYPVGTPHPGYGFMAVQPRIYGGFIIWSCPMAQPSILKLCGHVALPQNDCSQPGNWTATIVETGARPALDLDMTVSDVNYNSVPNADGLNSGVFISYFDDGLKQWSIASCRGEPDPSFTSPWNCGSPGATIPLGGNAALGWNYVPLFQSETTSQEASTVRVINGNVTAAFMEQDHLYMATCPNGLNCDRSWGWHANGVTNAYGFGSATSGYGFLAGGANNDLYVMYPNVSGSNNTINFLAEGYVSTP